MIRFTRGRIYTSQQQHPRHVRFETNFCGRLGQLANAAYIRATSLQQQQQRTRKFNAMHISSTPAIKKSLPACGTMLRHVAEGSRLTGNSMTCRWGTAPLMAGVYAMCMGLNLRLCFCCCNDVALMYAAFANWPSLPQKFVWKRTCLGCCCWLV